jgi:ribosomal protein L11 methylase PrmA
MELGCGSGLLGVMAARLSPAHLVLTDGDESSVANCLHNLRLNTVLEGDGSRAQSGPLHIRDVSFSPKVRVYSQIGQVPVCPHCCW